MKPLESVSATLAAHRAECIRGGMTNEQAVASTLRTGVRTTPRWHRCTDERAETSSVQYFSLYALTAELGVTRTMLYGVAKTLGISRRERYSRRRLDQFRELLRPHIGMRHRPTHQHH